jgi:hypothetical protein
VPGRRLKRPAAIEGPERDDERASRVASREPPCDRPRSDCADERVAERLDANRERHREQQVRGEPRRDEIRPAFDVPPGRDPTARVGIPERRLMVREERELGQVTLGALEVPVLGAILRRVGEPRPEDDEQRRDHGHDGSEPSDLAGLLGPSKKPGHGGVLSGDWLRFARGFRRQLPEAEQRQDRLARLQAGAVQLAATQHPLVAIVWRRATL